MYFRKLHLSPKTAIVGWGFLSSLSSQSFASIATIMEDFSLFSASRAVTDLIHLGLSMSLSSGLKVVSSFSSSVHAGASMIQSSGDQCLSPEVARGILFMTMFTVGVSRPMLNPNMPMSLRAFVMPLMFARAGSAGRSPTVVSTRSSFLLYSAYANLVEFDALLIASLILAGVQSLAPTLLPFSTDLTSSLRCLACGVEGAEGALFSFPTPGAGDAFLLLVCTSLKPSVFMPAAAMADQASFFFSLTSSVFFFGAGVVVGYRTGTRGGFGAGGLGFWARGLLVCWGGCWGWPLRLAVCGSLALVTEAIMRSSISAIFFSMLSSRIAM